MCLAVACGAPRDCGVAQPIAGQSIGGLQIDSSSATTTATTTPNVERDEICRRAIRALFIFGGAPNIAGLEVLFYYFACFCLLVCFCFVLFVCLLG